MRLHDIESAVLLPRFAHNAEWEQNALDQVVKVVRAKSFAMGAPYTREAISALSDAELQAFYFQYGIAIYYPDLSRETRENMLFELSRVYRSLGTPYSVELLCEYIFDGADKVGVEIHDNLAFNASGELVDDSLLDLFDVDLFPASPELSQDKIERIVENIFRFCRNSQTLRDVIVEFPSVAECNVVSCDFESFVCTIGEYDVAVVPEPESDYEFILVDSTTGRITYGVETLTEIEFTPTGYFTIDEGNEVVFVEQSPFPEVEMDVFFSSRGRSGAADTSVSPSGVYPLYDESGSAITYSAVSTYTAENVYNRAGQRPMYGTSVSFTESGGQLAAVFDRYGNVFRISLKIES